jgi:DNA-binding GntR family transcriptional regulator
MLLKKLTAMQMPPTRAEAAADELRRRILGGIYPGGMQLRQAQLAEELGISRIPFREALVQLEAEGLVTATPHKGATVAAVYAEDVEEQFMFRALIEPELLKASGPRLDKDDFVRLHAILQEYSEELRSSNATRWGELNSALHSVLLGRANLPRMMAVAAQLLQSTDRFTRMQLILTDGRERAEQEHFEIVNLCENGQFDAAAEVLRKHIAEAGTALAMVLLKRKPVEEVEKLTA